MTSPSRMLQIIPGQIRDRSKGFNLPGVKTLPEQAATHREKDSYLRGSLTTQNRQATGE